MADTTDGGTTSDGSTDGSSSGTGSIVDFLTQPLGMAAVAGFIAAVVAGWYIL